jgi:hypothetical protein
VVWVAAQKCSQQQLIIEIMKNYFLFLILASVSYVRGQQASSKKSDTTIYVPDIDPAFVEGNICTWILSNCILDSLTFDEIPTSIKIQFVVEIDGSLSNFEPAKEQDIKRSQALISCLKKSPKWKPGVANNKNVRAYYSIKCIVTLK